MVVKQINGYNIIKKIGEGATSNVYLAEKNGQEYAVKEFKTDTAQSIQKEVDLLKHASECAKNDPILDKGLIKFENYFHRTNGNKTTHYIVMEYFPNSKELFDKVKDGEISTFGEAFEIVYQLLQIFNSLKGCNLAHQDVKLENILVGDNNDVKLIDLGFACTIDMHKNKECEKMSGTICYIAPELLRGHTDKFADRYTKDVYSLGVTIYTMFHGSPPYSTECNKKNMHRIHLYVKKSDTGDADLDHMINNMLKPDPKNRWNIKTILGYFKAYWV